jgi:hypothetical protein
MKNHEPEIGKKSNQKGICDGCKTRLYFERNPANKDKNAYRYGCNAKAQASLDGDTLS